MSEIDRRTVLKLGMSIVAGAITNEALYSLRSATSDPFSSATGIPTGNVGMQEHVMRSCDDSSEEQTCEDEFELPWKDKVAIIFVNPIREEITFRAIPSLVVSVREQRATFMETVFTGTGGFGLSRRELIVGAVSTLLFGATHNITNAGFDIKTLPLYQTIFGGVYWYLQRKLGILSNTTAHILNNYKAISK